MGFGKKLRQLRKSRNLSLKDVARDIGVSIGAVSEWEIDKNEPNPRNRQKLAEYYEINESELLENTTAPNTSNENKNLIKIPVISWTHASQFAHISDPYPPGVADDYVYTTYKGENMFCLNIQGDCMEPKFFEGDRIVVDPNMSPDNGDFVIIKHNGDNEATFKQYKKYGNKIVLHPLNPKYDDIELKKDKEYEIVGVVVEKNTKIK